MHKVTGIWDYGLGLWDYDYGIMIMGLWNGIMHMGVLVLVWDEWNRLH